MIEAAVTMAATLLSFGSVLVLKHAVGLSTGSVLLAVVLALSIGRQEGTRGTRDRRMLVISVLLLPLLAVAAGEVSERMFTHPNVGDTLFVAGMAAAIWIRRFGDIGRHGGALLTTTLTATLIAPGPVVPIGPHAPTRWWGAVVALIALAWVLLTRYGAERLALLGARRTDAVAPQLRPQPAPPGAPWQRRIPASTKMALQMAAALAGAFAAGRAAFGLHWTWVVLTAFIVGSGNRGRADVTQKAILRVAGAIVGTLIATALANAFPAHDDWSVVTIFAVLTLALWLRTFSYAYWAAGMTAALALLYGFYGERGSHLLL
ncbi:MAG: FUSC family protein, partial [Mycobacteriales bacterium]